MKTNCVADRRNSEFWQRIGQPYVRNLGRYFVAVVEIETDRCAVCLAELDAVHSEADIQANVRCPTPFWSGTRAGNKQSPNDTVLQNKIVLCETIKNGLLFEAAVQIIAA